MALGRKTGGRKKGTTNKRSADFAKKAAEEGVTPLEFMLKIMRDETCPEEASPEMKIAFHSLRFEAAKAAAPYIHPRLSAVEHSGAIDLNRLDDDELDNAIGQAAAEAGVVAAAARKGQKGKPALH